MEKSREGAMSLQEILNVLSGKGINVLLIFMSLPFCQPIQIPGTSTPFGIVIALIGLRMSVRHGVFLPKFLLNKKISQKVIHTIVTKSLWLLGKIKRWVHPRMQWACRYPFMRFPNGMIIFLAGLFLALPLPIPFANIPAAWVVFLIALGLLEDDGMLVCIAYGIMAIGITALLFLGFSLLRK
jgi:hypothetical protein